jgi:hypothetical protein
LGIDEDEIVVSIWKSALSEAMWNELGEVTGIVVHEYYHQIQ